MASQEEQFKFLISCIRYSNNGKVSSEYVLPDLMLDGAIQGLIVSYLVRSTLQM